MALHLSTYLSRSPASLLSRVQTLTKSYAGHDLTFLFSLSANIPGSEDLGRVVNSLTALEKTRTIGCLSSPLGGTRINGRSIEKNVVSLSVAVFHSHTVKYFRSTIPGKEEIQVGRWHAFRRKGAGENKEYSLKEGTSWEDVWKNNQGVALPEELRTLE